MTSTPSNRPRTRAIVTIAAAAALVLSSLAAAPLLARPQPADGAAAAAAPSTKPAKRPKLRLGYVKAGDLPPTSVATGSRGGADAAAVAPVVIAPALSEQQRSAKPPPSRPGGVASAGAAMPAFYFYLPADSGPHLKLTSGGLVGRWFSVTSTGAPLSAGR